MATTILIIVVCGLVLASIGFVILTWFRFVPEVLRLLRGVPWIIGHAYSPVSGSQDYDITSRDGTRLRVSLLPQTSAARQGSIIFIHGLGQDRWAAVPYVGDLRKQGFDVFSVDMRNHGQSEVQSSYTPRPWITAKEVEDVLAVVDFVSSPEGAGDEQVALLGVSRGANVALCAAAQTRKVRAVVTDGAFPTGAMLRHYIRRYMRTHPRPRVRYLADVLPAVCLASYCAWAKLLFRVLDHAEVVNVERAVRHVTQPVFMIHAQRDRYVPEQTVHALRKCLSGRSKLWIVPGVKHNGAAIELTAEYDRRVVRFLSHTFSRPSDSCSTKKSSWLRAVTASVPRRPWRGWLPPRRSASLVGYTRPGGGRAR